MESDTNTAKIKTDRSERPEQQERRTGSLTLRILTVNMVAPMILVFGLLYMGQYRDGLISAEIETLKVQAQLFAGAIAEGAIKPAKESASYSFSTPEDVEILVPELARRMVRRLGETTNSRTRLFDIKGDIMADSHRLIGPGGVVQMDTLEPPEDDFTFSAALAYLGTQALDLLPVKDELPRYPVTTSQSISDYPDASKAIHGQVNATAWEAANGEIVMTAAAPVQKVKHVMGIVMLTKDGREIEKAMVRVRFDVLTVFLGTLSLTIFLSLYLAGIIGRPLKKLAKAAEAIRQGKSRHINIPDLTHRNDEIGELSQALQDMTQALWDRMDSIEGFAADVAHELKNPLTSLRSAVETASKVKKPADRKKLMEIILHDVQRLDRLISDISNASRLDAELSREEMGEVNLSQLLERLVEFYKSPQARSQIGKENMDDRIFLEIPKRKNLDVRGNEGRLAQVFENLISNALSFSPPDSPVIVRVMPEKRTIRIVVEDEGPGIPQKKLDSIFERFYSERPEHEDYGSHSGLGLSIARQIVEAHGGRIYAENIIEGGNIKGAGFTVVLDRAV